MTELDENGYQNEDFYILYSQDNSFCIFQSCFNICKDIEEVSYKLKILRVLRFREKYKRKNYI